MTVLFDVVQATYPSEFASRCRKLSKPKLVNNHRTQIKAADWLKHGTNCEDPKEHGKKSQPTWACEVEKL